MSDSNILTAKDLESTFTSVSPYDIPRLIWNTMETYFDRKYGVKVVESYPKEPVSQPTVSWRIFKRTPGGGGQGHAQARGQMYYGVANTSKDGMVQMAFLQQFNVQYEFAIFGTNSAEANKIAWDFEQAVNQSIGIIQSQVPGFAFSFTGQSGDGSFDWKSQDDMNVRTIRYEANVPVFMSKVVPQLRSIEYIYKHGSTARDVYLTRASTSVIQTLEVEDSTIVEYIGRVDLLQSDGTWTTLLEDTDYYAKRDDQGASVYIEWNDEYGLTPDVNGKFRVIYLVATTITNVKIN